MARELRKNDRGPAEKDRKVGIVKSAVVTNWTNVIRGPLGSRSDAIPDSHD